MLPCVFPSGSTGEILFIMHYFSGFRFLERGNERTTSAGLLGQVIGIEDLRDGVRAVGGKLFVVQAGFVGCGDYG